MSAGETQVISAPRSAVDPIINAPRMPERTHKACVISTWPAGTARAAVSTVTDDTERNACANDRVSGLRTR